MNITFRISSSDDQLLIKKGQDVDFQTPLSKHVFSKDFKINLAQRLQFPPQNIFMHLNKVVGDEVAQGEVIAKKKSLLGEKKYASEIAGVVKEINHEEGSLLITTKGKKEKTKYAFFKGEVEAVKGNEITLEVEKSKTFKAKSVANDFGGEVLFVDSDAHEQLTEEEVKGKVLFTKTLAPYNRVKFEVMGARGFVTTDRTSEESKSPHATLETEKELNDIVAVKYPYCMATKKDNLIYLYE